MSSGEESKILEYIKKMGFDFEIHVMSLLKDKGWSVYPEYLYFDKQTKKVRTIDIVADYFYEKFEFKKTPRLIVECKKSEKPWVFFSTHPFEDFTSLPRRGVDELFFTSIGSTFFSLVQPYIDLTELPSLPKEISDHIVETHFFDRNLPNAHSCHVVFREHRKEDSPDDFQKAIYQIRGAFPQISEGLPRRTILPVIVLKGKMFEYIKKGEQERLEPRNHILFSTSMLFPEEFEPSKDTFPPHIIDVVRDTHFPCYLQLLEKDLEILRQISDVLNKEKKT
jgi:hypothetical protein